MTAKRLTGAYFGTRRADFFPAEFMQRIADKTMFADITAGTGQFPYRVATELNIPVMLMERCPYVGFLLQSVFSPSSPTTKQLGKITPRRGYLTIKRETDAKLQNTFSEAMAQYVDGVAYQHAKDPAVLHALGRSITRHLSFRNRGWSRTVADGDLSVNLPIETMESSILRALNYVEEMRKQINVPCSVYIGDTCKEFPKVSDWLVRGGTIYADPAWPYAKEFGGGNPYLFSYEDISSILVQSQLKLDEVWERSNPEKIFADVKGWIDNAFDKGAKQFILTTQDTNYPTPDEVEQWLVDRYHVECIMTIQDWSASANRHYTNYWMFVKGPR